MIVCTLFTSFGQLFWKIGADQLTLTVSGVLSNLPLLLGFILYGAGAFMLVIAMKYGELSVLYPFISLGFIWVSLLSVSLLNEQMTLVNWIGVLAIISGVSFIGFGRDKA